MCSSLVIFAMQSTYASAICEMKTVLARFDPTSSTVAAISFTYKQRQQQLAANLARMDRFLQSFAQAVASQQEALAQTEVSEEEQGRRIAKSIHEGCPDRREGAFSCFFSLSGATPVKYLSPLVCHACALCLAEVFAPSRPCCSSFFFSFA